METLNQFSFPEDAESGTTDNNEPSGYGDDTLGENTEVTPLAAELLKDEDEGVAAKENQENKDPSGETD